MNRDIKREEIIKTMNGLGGGVCMRENKNSSFKFCMYLTEAMKMDSITALDLTPRAYNCLRKNSIDTVGDLVKIVTTGKLAEIRSLGKGSVRDVMQCLFLYQLKSMSDERREKYLSEIVAMNAT